MPCVTVTFLACPRAAEQQLGMCNHGKPLEKFRITTLRVHAGHSKTATKNEAQTAARNRSNNRTPNAKIVTKTCGPKRGHRWRQFCVCHHFISFGLLLGRMCGRVYSRILATPCSRGLRGCVPPTAAKDSQAPHGPQGQGLLHTSG